MSTVTATKQKETQSPISCKDARAKDSLREHISRKAYELYEEGGREHGHDEAHWHLAESQVAERITDIHESAFWYSFNYPVDNFRTEEISVTVEPQGAAVLAEQLQLADSEQFKNSLASRESLFLTAHWPSEVDVSTASAYIKDGILSVTAKRIQAG